MINSGTLRHDAIRSTKYYARYVTNTKTNKNKQTKKYIYTVYTYIATIIHHNVQKYTQKQFDFKFLYSSWPTVAIILFQCLPRFATQFSIGAMQERSCKT